MVSMTSAPTAGSWLPRDRSLVADDLDAAPDDGHRYELIDGVLVVSPSPVTVHQRIVLNTAVLLVGPCPADLEVFIAPFDVRLSDDTKIQPDVLVARRSDLTDKNLPAAPVLAVEILSPSTRGVDLLLKKDRLERAGCPSYWVIDPADGGRLRAWDLDESGRYLAVADIRATETWTAVLPYAVTVTPRDLLA